MPYGKYTYGNPKVLWGNSGNKLSIGNFCSIAQNVTIYLGNGLGHDTSFVTTYPFGYIHQKIFPNIINSSRNSSGDVSIGNDVWIGDNVTIMSGVTIGNGSVIATNSHVVKDVEPYSIVGGNPAKLIRYRFSSDQIKHLLNIQWWLWEDDKINKFISNLCSNNIDEFIRLALESK